MPPNIRKKNKIALITGITGQDGSYLAEFLLSKSYEIHGLVRRSSNLNTSRIEHLKGKNGKLFLHYGDLADAGSLESILAKVSPNEIYHLGAQSDVRVSFDIPEFTANITGLGTLRMLEAMRKNCPKAKFYQASSSEMFGNVIESPQTEKTPFNPQSPYGIAKVFAHEMARRYRDAYGLFVSCGILFNHESPRRGENFVSRKIVKGAVRIKAGLQDKLYLGNLDAKRDWGYAPEYCRSMWLILQRPKPDDYVIATGESHSVREFTERAFVYAGINLVWEGGGFDEKGLDKKSGRILVEIDPVHFRPNEVSYLRGNIAKAKRVLDWKPKVTFNQLIKIMMKEEFKNINGKIEK